MFFYFILLTKSKSSAIVEHSLNSLQCVGYYSYNFFSILGKARKLYNLSVSESLFIKTLRNELCKQ